MTTPERKIKETNDLLDSDITVMSAAERQILSNQLTILLGMKVLLSWDQE